MGKWIHNPSGWENITAIAEDMQYTGYGLVWWKVNGVDLPAAEVYFQESWQKKLYASHSNVQHNKNTASESDETDFFPQICSSRSNLQFCSTNFERKSNQKKINCLSY